MKIKMLPVLLCCLLYSISALQLSAHTPRSHKETSDLNIPLEITVHVQDKGDITGHDNEWVGTFNENRRL